MTSIWLWFWIATGIACYLWYVVATVYIAVRGASALVASVGATHRSPAHEKTTQRPSGLRDGNSGKPTSPGRASEPSGTVEDAAQRVSGRVLGPPVPPDIPGFWATVHPAGIRERQASWRIAARCQKEWGARTGGVAFAQVSAIIEFMAS